MRKEGRGVTSADVAKEVVRVAKVLGKDPLLVGFRELAKEGKYPASRITSLGGLTAIKRTYLDDTEHDEGEIRDMQTLRTEVMRDRRERGDQESILNRIEMSVREMPKLKIDKGITNRLKRKAKKTERILKLTLSDIHIGADLGRETKCSFGVVEEARAVAYVVKNVCQYKTEHRAQTELVVELLGDIINNHLHPGSSGAPVHIQNLRAMHILTQALGVFATQFKKVTVFAAIGNHGRDKAYHQKKATAQKYNAHEMSIYGAVKMSLSDIPNIEFNLDYRPTIEYNLLGHWFMSAHGDTHLNWGSIGKTISIAKIADHVSLINSQQDDGKKFAVMTTGHLHTATMTRLPNGALVLINGTLTPPDMFGEMIGHRTAKQDQLLVEVTKDYAVGDMRLIDASKSATDKSLDKIIKPWDGL